MKNYLLTLVFATLAISCYSQQYQTFPTKDAYWLYVIDNGQIPYTRYHYIQLMFDGRDTIVNGNTYKTIIRREYIDSTIYQPARTNGWQYTNNGLANYTNKIANRRDTQVIAIREDNKRIMSIMLPGSAPWNKDSSEIVLYDFNYGIGDTIKTSYVAKNGCIVAGYDSVLVGGTYHKRWHFSNCSPYIIEGIGDQLGLYLLPNGQNVCNLACFNRSGYGSYSQEGTSCFYIHKYGTPAGISDKDNSADVSVSPNPFDAELKISSSIPINLNIYNTVGAKVYSVNNVTNHTIPTRYFTNGVYFVETYNQEMGLRKIVKVLK